MSRRLDPKITMRALQLIAPKPARTEEARKQVDYAIATIKSPRAQPRTVNKRELEQIASALRRAIVVLKKPAVSDLQRRLHYERNPGLAGLLFGPPLVDQLPKLREELAALAAAADSACQDIKLGRRRGSGPTMCAALWAHDLLRRHGVKPTCYAQGKFFRLAAVLYEGGTGIAGADVERACRQVFHHRRVDELFGLPPSQK
jgi:hypothetical protein